MDRVMFHPNGCQGSTGLLPDRSGYREERDWLPVNRHLHDLVESMTMNVGGLYVEMSSPSLKRVSVGGPIVVGARESRVHGEGGQ